MTPMTDSEIARVFLSTGIADKIAAGEFFSPEDWVEILWVFAKDIRAYSNGEAEKLYAEWEAEDDAYSAGDFLDRAFRLLGVKK